MSEGRNTDVAITRGSTELVADTQEAPPVLLQSGSSDPPPLPPQALQAAAPEAQALKTPVPDPKSKADSPEGDSPRGVRINTPSKADSPQGVRGNTLGGVLAARRCAGAWRKMATRSSDVSTTRPMTTAKEAKYFKGIAFQEQTVIESPNGAEANVANLQDLAHLAPARLRAVTRTSGGTTPQQSSYGAEAPSLERVSASSEDIDRHHKLMAVTRAQDRVILPFDRRKVWWDRLILACVFYSAISVRVRVRVRFRVRVGVTVRASVRLGALDLVGLVLGPLTRLLLRRPHLGVGAGEG